MRLPQTYSQLDNRGVAVAELLLLLLGLLLVVLHCY
jgi:hypothetical protein